MQLSNDHEIFNNVSIANNIVNVGSGTVGLIPDGTGMLMLSTDTTSIHHNIITNNNSFGLAVVDQEAINALAGSPVFSPTSPDQASFDNDVFDNILQFNAAGPGHHAAERHAALRGSAVRDLRGVAAWAAATTAPRAPTAPSAPAAPAASITATASTAT